MLYEGKGSPFPFYAKMFALVRLFLEVAAALLHMPH